MTTAWQRANCPPGLDLRPFQTSAGQLVEATIIELGGERLYVPGAWLRRPGVALYRTAAPPGVRAATGGSGGLDPTLGLGEFPGTDAKPNCLGVVHRARFGGGDGRDPDFYLTLNFRPGSAAESRSTDPAARAARPVGAHSLRLNFMVRGDPDRMWDGSPALIYPLRPGPAVIRTGEGDRRLTAVALPTGWFLSFPVNRRIAMQFAIPGSIDRSNWPAIVRRAREIYAWLRTAPANRDNAGTLQFLTADLLSRGR